MNNNTSKGISYTTGFFMLFGLSLIGLVVSSLIGGLLIVAFTGGNLKALEEAVSDPKNASLLRWIQVFSVLVSMLLPAWIVASYLNRKPFQLLGYKTQVNLKQVGLVILIVFASLFLAGALGWLNKAIPLPLAMKQKFDAMEQSYGQQVEMMVDLKSMGGFLVSLVLMAFLPALCEETLFRGGLQNFLTRATNKPWLAIIVVSTLFSLVHFSFYGFLPRLYLGIMLGLIFYTTGNIWLSVAAHFFNNALALTQAYVMTRQGKSISEAMNEDMPGLYWGFLALPLIVLLYRALKKETNIEAAGQYTSNL